MKAALGRILCRFGWHHWGRPFPTVRTSGGWSLGGCHAQDCQRLDCDYRLWHEPS
jgi:hypothetical protein